METKAKYQFPEERFMALSLKFTGKGNLNFIGKHASPLERRAGEDCECKLCVHLLGDGWYFLMAIVKSKKLEALFSP
jgi:hypothetical protein